VIDVKALPFFSYWKKGEWKKSTVPLGVDMPCKYLTDAVPHPRKQGAAEGKGILTQRQEALADLWVKRC
jgi:hypothetical protein